MCMCENHSHVFCLGKHGSSMHRIYTLLSNIANKFIINKNTALSFSPSVFLSRSHTHTHTHTHKTPHTLQCWKPQPGLRAHQQQGELFVCIYVCMLMCVPGSYLFTKCRVMYERCQPPAEQPSIISMFHSSLWSSYTSSAPASSADVCARVQVGAWLCTSDCMYESERRCVRGR